MKENEIIKYTFYNLREQAKKKQSNGNVCNSVLSDKYDVTYYQEPETNEYLLDRNADYTEVLANNDSINIYGDSLLQTNNEDVVTGWNDSVVAKVSNDKVNKISYNDYGYTKDIASGHGYNAEMMDHTGLIYLRARYYDPSVARFIQIDTHYDGEKESVVSQNRYAYTMNNPYKYVDKDGKQSKKKKSPFDYLTMSNKEFKKFLKNKSFIERIYYIQTRKVYKQAIKTYNGFYVSINSGKSKNEPSKNTGGFVNIILDATEGIKEKIKCPDKTIKNLTASNEIVSMIKYFEGFYEKAYSSLEGGSPTIGFGHKFYGDDYEKYGNKIISEKEATQLLVSDLTPFINIVNSKAVELNYQLTQNQFDGILSMNYNTGNNGREYTKTMINYIKVGDFNSLKTWMNQFTYGGGQQWPGLIKRRDAEYRVITEGVYLYQYSA